MTDNPRAVIGNNNPPDPIDVALQPYADVLIEAENWMDGAPVENQPQLEATDLILKELKAARKAVDVARDEATKPLHEAWKAEIARWKPTQDDLDAQVKCIVAAQASFKSKLAAEKEAIRVAKEKEAQEAARIARETHDAAKAGSIEDQRHAAELLKEADKAGRDAHKAGKDTVKGMRTVQRYTIDDHRAALHWIARNDKAAMTDFIEEYVRRNFKARPIDGVAVTTDKEAY